MQYNEPNCEVSTNQFFPLYRYNPFMQGMGKGHFLACKYLIKTLCGEDKSN
jgi:hypothetical protein